MGEGIFGIIFFLGEGIFGVIFFFWERGFWERGFWIIFFSGRGDVLFGIFWDYFFLGEGMFCLGILISERVKDWGRWSVFQVGRKGREI